MKSFFSLLIVLACNIIFSSTVYASDSDIICNSCDTENDFKSLAKSLPQGTAVIVNPDEGLAYSYKIVIEPLDGVLLIPKVVPAEVYNAIDKYQSLKQSFASFSVSSRFDPTSQVNATSNGCGAQGSWTSDYIPNEPFGDACDLHDVCYGSSTAKSICDIAFLNDMYQIIDDLMQNAGKWEKLIMEKLYTLEAKAYYKAVDKFGEDAYCDATTKTNAAECVPFNKKQWALDGNMTPSVDGLGNSVYTMNCELWSFPDGNGGQYTLLRNCTVSSFQD